MASTTALPSASKPTKIILQSTATNPTQPHTSTITDLSSTPNTIPTGSLLALNDNYIVYAVKNGLVRVIERSPKSNLRTLLRGHKERITDASFFEPTSDVLASVSPGDCRVWRVFGREAQNELGSEMLLEIRKGDDSGDVDCSLERVIWHPVNPNHLMLLHKGSSVATFVQTTQLVTAPSTEEGTSHPVCQMKDQSDVNGMLNLIVTDEAEGSDAGICDLSWSHQDPRHVLTAHKDGCVRLWDLEEKVEANGVTSAQRMCTLQVGEGVQRCFFLESFQDKSSALTSPFLTYSTNGEVALWSPFTTPDSPPTILRIFQFVNDDGNANENVSVSVCAIPPVSTSVGTAEEKPPSVFVLLSDLNGTIHALHLASEWKDSSANPKIASVTGFDYVTYFKSLQPIYSQQVVTSLDDTSDAEQWNLDLYCVQSKAVQVLTLSPAMCLAPTPLDEATLLPDGLTVEPLGKEADAPGPAELPVPEFEEDETMEAFEDYEEFDDAEVAVDESFDVVVEKAPVEKTPETPLPSFLGGGDSSGAFSNWLGNLAASSGPVASESGSAGGMTPVKSELDLSSVPLPEAPEVAIRSVSAPPKSPTVVPELLSPMEILGMAVKKDKEKEKGVQAQPQPVKVQPEVVVVKEEKKSTKKTKSVKANDDKKITILKREDNTPKKVQAPPTIAKAPPVSGGGGGVTKDEIDQIVRKALSQHIQKHETIITAEIQKAVRYEVQSGLVPALNKTVAQTLEQTVAKTVKSQVSKTMKESMKSNNAEIVASISANIQEPVVNSFHKTMREVMVPAYENGTRQMFEQISTSIETGMEKARKESDETAKIMDSMVKRMDAMGKTIEVLIKAVAQLQRTSVAPTQAAASPAVAPAPPVNEAELLRKKIVELLGANEFEKAFTHALSVSNSAMALFVCKHSDLAVVLESDTPKLSQPIMLCLMQQLGANLANDDDLQVRIAWLQSMALTIDPQDESIKKHIGGVVQQLVANLQAKMAGSDPHLRRHLQMLLQVIRGLMA